MFGFINLWFSCLFSDIFEVICGELSPHAILLQLFLDGQESSGERDIFEFTITCLLEKIMIMCR